MAHHPGKDQPPAYVRSDYHAPTNSSRGSHLTAPNHSTQASKLSLATKNGTYASSQYLELTFSIMVRCRGTFEPIVVAIDEDYDTLLDDFDSIFRQMSPSGRSLRLHKMKVVWEKGWKESWSSYGSDFVNRQWHSSVKPGNLTAILRLLKAQSDRSYIEVD